MKSTIRQTIARALAIGALGAIGTSLLGTLAVNPAIALPSSQVADKLSNVPVFVLGSDDGLILVSREQEGGAAQPSLLVFMNGQEAEVFLAQNTQANPDFAPNAQVSLTNLEAIYQESQANSEQPLSVVYVPEQAEASQAAALNTGYEGGVPLFFAQFEDGSLAPVEQADGETIFPLFLSRSDLETVLTDLEARNPEARAAVSVGVLPLEVILREMESSDDELLNQIRLLPDSETISEIRSQLAAPEGTAP